MINDQQNTTHKPLIQRQLHEFEGRKKMQVNNSKCWGERSSQQQQQQLRGALNVFDVAEKKSLKR